jgi:hypothetical protein
MFVFSASYEVRVTNVPTHLVFIDMATFCQQLHSRVYVHHGQ